jgi:protein tyrosine phosphatase (PTP) superfamily phosphohydrolase (DUF442 family)
LSSRIYLALAIALTFGLTPYPVQASEEPVAASLQGSIDNFDQVSPSIWRGAHPSDIALEQLAQHGVKTIIDLRQDCNNCEHEHVYAWRLGLHYVHIPMNFKKPSSSQIVQFLNVVNDDHSGTVFVHCRQGADRTGTLIGIYRTVMQGWKFDKTYAEMRDHHFKPFLFGMKKSVEFYAANPESGKKLPGLVNHSNLDAQTSLVAVGESGG